MQLRPYQEIGLAACRDAHMRGARNVLYVCPTGGGKTVVVSRRVKDHEGASCVIAHRQELVAQISLALARNSIRHRIIGPPKVAKLCVRIHLQELGKSYFDASSQVAVAGVDTLRNRKKELASWLPKVGLWIIDEAHHVLKDNKWGEACAMFPNAEGMGVTATPLRADAKGLGRNADGVFDEMVVGPAMRELIDQGYLTDYKIYAPPNDLDLSTVKIGATGDYVKKGLDDAVRTSHVLGDVVEHYIRVAKGKMGITFTTSVKAATALAAQFEASGVPARVVSAETPDSERIDAIDQFGRGVIKQLVNVDLFGEGFDLPAIEVVSMARPTQSYGLFCQQFGRALRIKEGKSEAIILDHVGNIMRHGLPDSPRTWTLSRKDKRKRKAKDEEEIKLKTCTECFSVYEAFLKACPFCGHVPAPAGRDDPDMVEGDLMELTPEALEKLRSNVSKMDMDEDRFLSSLAARNVPPIGRPRLLRKHKEAQEAQGLLRLHISWWAGARRMEGLSDSEAYRKFYHDFGMDVMTAQALKSTEALDLAERIAK